MSLNSLRPTTIKVAFLGDDSTGKTTLLHRKMHGEFKANTASTIGAIYDTIRHSSPTAPVRLAVWDTAGQQRYESVIPMFIKGAHIIVICYRRLQNERLSGTSYQRVYNTYDEKVANVEGSNHSSLLTCAFTQIKKYIDLINRLEIDAKIYFVETYIDVNPDEKVPAETILPGAERFRVSSKTGEGVDELFDSLFSYSEVIAPDIFRDHIEDLHIIRDARNRSSLGFRWCCSINF